MGRSAKRAVPAGCAHLTTLLTEMGSAVVQSTAAFPPGNVDRHLARLQAPEQTTSPVNLALNTCHMWAENGPLTQEVRELLAGKRRWGVPPEE